MKRIHIKTKRKEGEERRHGVMLVPDNVTNDADLYAMVRSQGSVEIRLFTKDNPLELENLVQNLTPSQFEAEWMGD